MDTMGEDWITKDAAVVEMNRADCVLGESWSPLQIALIISESITPRKLNSRALALFLVPVKSVMWCGGSVFPLLASF